MIVRALRLFLQMPEFLRLIERQQALLRVQQEQMVLLQIEYSRWGRDIISEFLVCLDKPEEQEETREMLHKALVDLSDEVARLEEHIV